MQHLLIVDGMNLLFQMFFGMPARIVNKDGKAIHGTLGFVGALRKIIKRVEPTHIVVLFDGEHENERAELLGEYKANRTDYSKVAEEDAPFSQLPDVYNALDFLDIPHTEIDEYEADDVISSYRYAYGREMKVTIASMDSDFFQLIDENVRVLRYRGEHTAICDTAYLQEKYGILPSQYVAFKSLTGDPADNIKGADKVGPKTAAALLHQFATLEGILRNAGQITKPSIRESILKNEARLKVNYKLIQLGKKAGLPFGIKELVYHDSGLTTTEVLKGIHLR